MLPSTPIRNGWSPASSHLEVAHFSVVVTIGSDGGLERRLMFRFQFQFEIYGLLEIQNGDRSNVNHPPFDVSLVKAVHTQGAIKIEAPTITQHDRWLQPRSIIMERPSVIVVFIQTRQRDRARSSPDMIILITSEDPLPWYDQSSSRSAAVNRRAAMMDSVDGGSVSAVRAGNYDLTWYGNYRSSQNCGESRTDRRRMEIIITSYNEPLEGVPKSSTPGPDSTCGSHK